MPEYIYSETRTEDGRVGKTIEVEAVESPFVAPCILCGGPCEHPDDLYCSDTCAIDAENDR